MSEVVLRKFSIPPAFERQLDLTLQKNLGLSLASTGEIAKAVQRMSDFYIEDGLASTPWSQRWCQIAQLAYYLPLNFMRAQSVIREAHRLGFFDSILTVTDFGSGLSPVQLALKSEVPDQEFEFAVVERSSDALSLARAMNLNFEVKPSPNSQFSHLLTASYSLTEMKEPPDWLFDYQNLILIEPSTRQDSRRLLELRRTLIQAGYHLWAPCTHQEACPLLEKSPSDWCHDRIHFERPGWMLDVEKRLPFQNQTLTFSYLVASRRPRPATTGTIRTVGDLMREKGKARQMVCRGPEREFFAWLSRHGEAQEIPRGVLCETPSNMEPKSNELRVQSPVTYL
jgi:hypothetical protein